MNFVTRDITKELTMLVQMDLLVVTVIHHAFPNKDRIVQNVIGHFIVHLVWPVIHYSRTEEIALLFMVIHVILI